MTIIKKEWYDGTFKMKDAFKIGDIGISVYENERGLELYDPKELASMLGDKELNNSNKKNLRNIMKTVGEENKLTVKVDEEAGPAKKTLVNVYGIYDIVYFLDTPEARKIRYSFTNILEEYRNWKGLSLGQFVKNCEANEIDKVYKNVYSARSSSAFINNLNEEDIFIKSVYTFICEKSKYGICNIIRSIDYFENPEILKNIDSHKIGEKLSFSLGISRLSQLLSEIVSVDSLNISDYILNNYPVEEINNNKYLSTDIFEKLIYNIVNNKCGKYIVRNDEYKLLNTKELIERILSEFIHHNNEFISNPLFDSLTCFRKITRNLDTTVYKIFYSYKNYYYQKGCDDDTIYTKTQSKMKEYIKTGKVYSYEELEEEY